MNELQNMIIGTPIDFTDCEIDRLATYGGSDQKRGIIYNGKRYMLKYADRIDEDKRNAFNSSYSNSILSEHVCCSILRRLGFDVQNTLLGFVRLDKDGETEFKPVVACENFVPKGFELVEFKSIESSVLTTKPGKIPRLNDLYEIFYKPNAYFDKDFGKRAMLKYWETFVIDALLGNFDRHANNWGYFINGETHEIKFAPIYDCGSCLYPQMADGRMNYVINNQEEINKRIDKFPTAALELPDRTKAIYKTLLYEAENPELVHAILETVPKLKLPVINEVIDEMPLTDIRKEFYKTMLKERYRRILLPAYNRLKGSPLGDDSKTKTIDKQTNDQDNIEAADTPDEDGPSPVPAPRI